MESVTSLCTSHELLTRSARRVSNGRCDVIMGGPFPVRHGGCQTEVVTSSCELPESPCSFGMEGADQKMSNNSKRNSKSPSSTHAFSGEDLENDRHDEALGIDGESTESEEIMEGLIVEGSGVREEEHSGKPYGSGTVVVASTVVNVPIRVPLPKRNNAEFGKVHSGLEGRGEGDIVVAGIPKGVMTVEGSPKVVVDEEKNQ
ncbi:Hypothetical predicted protein [Prunus dulcis]|uniref:Uncharacterized protein n=1 Tax=Prunus dulcis TaxID=3755 RepID=A0A5E4FJF6_PRUDU|nr:Hypothetical predicted protein [Prunus dulcis]